MINSLHYIRGNIHMVYTHMTSPRPLTPHHQCLYPHPCTTIYPEPPPTPPIDPEEHTHRSRPTHPGADPPTTMHQYPQLQWYISILGYKSYIKKIKRFPVFSFSSQKSRQVSL